MARLVAGVSLSATVWADTGTDPTAAAAISPNMVEILVIAILFE
jgi:hypothetical protein